MIYFQACPLLDGNGEAALFIVHMTFIKTSHKFSMSELSPVDRSVDNSRKESNIVCFDSLNRGCKALTPWILWHK